MTDHYAALGVPKTASAAEIKQAFRKLASQHHPDKGGDTAKFQGIQAAYEILGDDAKRAEYDTPRPSFGNFPSGGAHFDFSNMHDIFKMFNQQSAAQARRSHARIVLYLSLQDIAAGGKKTVAIATTQGRGTVEIDIPLGLNDGDNVQYNGLAPGGQDLVVTFQIHPNSQWQRDGLNLTTEHMTSVWDLILGAEINIQNILGQDLSIAIPPRCQPGVSLRLKSHGLRDRQGTQGDMFVRLRARIPDNLSPELIQAIENHRG